MPEERYRTAIEHATHLVRQWIFRGVLKPGTAIDQVALGQKLGMSRIPIRTALERLATEGLINLTPRKGATVPALSQKEMNDLYFVRGRLEGMAVELASDNLTDANLRELEQMLTVASFQVEAGDLEGFLQTCKNFHFKIYATCGNDVLVRVIEGLWTLCERYRRAYLQLPNRLNESLAEHRQVLHSLANRTPSESVSLMREHLNKTKQILTDCREHMGSELDDSYTPALGVRDASGISLAWSD